MQKPSKEVKQKPARSAPGEPCSQPPPTGGTFVYDLDDLLLDKVIPLERLAELDDDKLSKIRMIVEEELRSEPVIGILRDKLRDVLPKIPGIPGIFVDPGGTSYLEFGQTFVSALFPDQVGQFTPGQIRVIAARAKGEILVSDEINRLLCSAAGKAL